MADWMPGAKEAKARAEAITKRRMLASALVTDLNTEFEDLKLTLELEADEYQSADLASLKVPLERAQAVLDNLFRDISEITGRPLPERVNDQQAFELVQPALRIESRVAEMRHWLEETRQKKTELDRPRQTASGKVEAVQRQRLQVDATFSEMCNLVEQMRLAGAENFPEVSAALITAQRELLTAGQLVDGGRQALQRKGYREAEDLALRSQRLLESCSAKFDMIRLAGTNFSHASQDAEDALTEALRQLTEAKALLTARAALLSSDPNVYLQGAIQRIGEARRAIKINPPQYVTCLRLSKEAISLITDTVAQAAVEVEQLKTGRLAAREGLRQLQEVVQLTRITLNSQKSVPVRANELYVQARNERDRLTERGQQLDSLKPGQLDKLVEEIEATIKKAQEATRLASETFR
ncbi:MAG: hypothetical protein HXX20_13820 [Chloroflexi bacterium]|nr:hypothetical protein [Chloroflexota bacterium]